MSRHQRGTPLSRLLRRLRWQRDPDLWTVPCRDDHGRRARLAVHLTSHGLTVTASTAGPVELAPLEVGRLRAALKHALLDFDRLSSEDCGRAAPVRESIPRPRVRRRLPPRPSVADIAARVSAPQNGREVDHDPTSQGSRVAA